MTLDPCTDAINRVSTLDPCTDAINRVSLNKLSKVNFKLEN